jgi:dihydroneopterin aldolase
MSTDEIFISGLDLPVLIGVPDAERAVWQVLRADVAMRPKLSFESMADSIEATLDYEAVANRLRALAAERPRKLIETLAAEMADMVLDQFGARWVRVELRKRILPGVDAVGVRIERSRD